MSKEAKSFTFRVTIQSTPIPFAEKYCNESSKSFARRFIESCTPAASTDVTDTSSCIPSNSV